MMRWAVLACAVVLVGAGDLVYVTGEEVPELEILEPVDGSVVRLLEGESAVMKFGVNFLKGQCNALECMRASVSGLRLALTLARGRVFCLQSRAALVDRFVVRR